MPLQRLVLLYYFQGDAIAIICFEHLKGYFVVKGFIMIGITIYATPAVLQFSAVFLSNLRKEGYFDTIKLPVHSPTIYVTHFEVKKQLIILSKDS